MSLKSYLHNIWEAVYTIFLGMKITARYGVDASEEITLQYPEETWEPFDRFRGFLHNDISKCISCNMCVKVCPVDCITLESVQGPDKKRYLTLYDINIGRCMYCGLCTEVCPTKCLTHTSGYEKAFMNRGEFTLNFVTEPPKIPTEEEVAAAKAEKEAKKAALQKQKAEEQKSEAKGTEKQKTEVQITEPQKAEEQKAEEQKAGEKEPAGASSGTGPVEPRVDPPDGEGGNG